MDLASLRKLFLVATLALAIPAFGGDAETTDYHFNRAYTATAPDTEAFAKASRDTYLIVGPLGSGADYIGQFQDSAGTPDWNGWTHWDSTAPQELFWHVDTYNVVSGTYSAWCGDIRFASCGVDDPEGGYGNDFNEILEWRGAVANNSLSCTVNVSAVVNYSSETGYDYSYLSFLKFDQSITNAWVADGTGVGEVVNGSTIYDPADYMGPGSDEVVIQFRFQSDGAASDEDCGWQGDGALQVDDVNITLSNGTGYSTGFEDGTLGEFVVVPAPGVGDFSKIWMDLRDVDPCRSNTSAQVAFIDDGIVVPGTGGSPCINWCYGPNGYIVNVLGGLSETDGHLRNFVESPIMAWPEGDYAGAQLLFDVYRHEDLSADSPGVAFMWGVRSTDSTDPADIETMEWHDRNHYEVGGPDYLRFNDFCTDLLVPGRRFVQVQLSVFHVGWAFGFLGVDATPAPYFDNVRLEAFPFQGPGMADPREIDIANDGFPAIGAIDLTNLGNNSIRFDMARNISPQAHLRNDPGDSIIFDVAPVRSGAVLNGMPRMYYKLKANPVFDPYRTSGLPNDGYVEGVPADDGTTIQENQYAFDLPDEGFLFPGDVLHYYVRGEDNVAGDVQFALLPADTSGFSDFDDPLNYNTKYVVRGLPTISARPGEPGEYDVPPILFWNDFGDRGGRNEWYSAFRNLGLKEGRDYDTYYTMGPSSGVGNGLGGRASQFHLEHYTDMLYTSGDLTYFTISNGDFEKDPSPDAALLSLWMQQGDKDIFLTGDNVAADLSQSGAVTSQFLQAFLGLNVVSDNVRSLIGTQSAPRIVVETGNPVFQTVNGWRAFGGCPVINNFDAVEPFGTGVRLAEFTNSDGVAGGYSYSAATLNERGDGSRAISMPYDFAYIWHDTEAPGGLSGRVEMLEDILSYFGIASNPADISDVPEALAFQAANYPNPFNPSTTIECSMPRRGHLSLKIFNVRGELVRTLVDGVQEQGTTRFTWDGTNELGRQVSSGVYFYEARTGNEVRVEKMALIK